MLVSFMWFSKRTERKGIVDLYTVAILVGLTLPLIVLLIAFPLLSNLVSVKSTVRLVVEVDDTGGRLNALLSSTRGGTTYSETLGNIRAGSAISPELTRTLDSLEWTLVVEGEDGNTLQATGDVRPDLGFFVQHPLPGLRKGRIGIDST